MAKRSPNYPEDEIVKFSVIRTSDAVIKEVSTPIVFVVNGLIALFLLFPFLFFPVKVLMPIFTTKLVDLKRKLADNECFGPTVAPVDRQRIFYLGRELKSGGRTLKSLGLGKFSSNKVLHLYVRPLKQGDSNEKDTKELSTSAAISTASHKRRRTNPTTRDHNNTPSNNTIELLDSSDEEVEIIDVL
mgnify:CR=1 FL=1|jgi:hypothetical protein